jgi:hypothetical protein
VVKSAILHFKYQGNSRRLAAPWTLLAGRQFNYQRSSIPNVELLKNGVQMRFDRAFGQIQAVRYKFVRMTLADQCRDLLFA